MVDLFPTLVDLAGLPSMKTCGKNSGSEEVCTEGASLVPLLSEPERQDWKSASFSQVVTRDRVIKLVINCNTLPYVELYNTI